MFKTGTSARPMPVKRRPAGTPRLREATLEDYPEIAALQKRNGLEVRPYADWASMWIGNPVWEASKAWRPIGWVLETDKREVVGTISSIPLEYTFRGRTLVAAAACAWAVDPNYRGFSTLILDRMMRQKGVDLLLSATVSANSEPPYRALQWSRVPAGRWDQAALWIACHRLFASAVLGTWSRGLGPALSLPAGGTLYCWDMLRRVKCGAARAADEVEVCTGFDSRFDGFWERLREVSPGALLGVRSRDALEWHFRRAASRQELWVATLGTGSKLTAYSIFDRLDNRAQGLKRVRLVDFQCLPGFEQRAAAFLSWAVARCRREGIHCLEITGEWLKSLGGWIPPYRRRLPSWTFYYRTNDSELHESLKDPAAWVATSFDADASL